MGARPWAVPLGLGCLAVPLPVLAVAASPAAGLPCFLTATATPHRPPTGVLEGWYHPSNMQTHKHVCTAPPPCRCSWSRLSGACGWRWC